MPFKSERLSEPQIEKGDWVRLTIEGRVDAAYSEGLVTIHDDDGRTLGSVFTNRTGIEKLEAPVEVFKPGDTLRAKGGEQLVTLGEDGYFSHQSRTYKAIGRQVQFTSEFWNRVEFP